MIFSHVILLGFFLFFLFFSFITIYEINYFEIKPSKYLLEGFISYIVMNCALKITQLMEHLHELKFEMIFFWSKLIYGDFGRGRMSVYMYVCIYIYIYIYRKLIS